MTRDSGRFLILLCFVLVFDLPGKCQAAERHALLVGCSRYSNNDIRPLPGAANDVKALQRLLTNEFRFDDVVVLSGWPEEASRRPTYANISNAFEQLIEKAKPNYQIVVQLSGHGFRFPVPKSQVNLLDPKNPEPDGLDEAFLAADYHAGENKILDNQIGKWLDRLKAKGAHVWIIFDSCFSGTMTRGGGQEVSRELTAAEAGIPLKAIKSAQRRGARARSNAPTSSRWTPDGFDLPKEDSSQGSVVAFYAAQEFEPAPEVTRPMGADIGDPQFKHGLLSFHLEQILRDRSDRITYGDLGRVLVSRYRADGRRRPTPYWEGDLDREVFGLRKWPRPQAILLERVDGQVRLVGGQLAKLFKNTIVAVYDMKDKEFARPIGHLRITQSTPSAAFVESTGFGKYPACRLASLPENSVCRIVSQEMGDTRIKLHLAARDGNWTKELETSIGLAIRQAATRQDAVFQVVSDAEKAEWIFVVLTQNDFSKKLGVKSLNSPAVLLPADAANLLFSQPITDCQSLERALSQTPHDRFSRRTISDPNPLVQQLRENLQKVFVWQNVWRLASAYAEPSPLVPRQHIRLEIGGIDGPSDTSTGRPLATSRLAIGDSVVVRLLNTGDKPYWYVALYLNGRFGIQHVNTGAIRGRNVQGTRESEVKRDVVRFTVNSNSIGSNGFVVIAVSQNEHTHRPDYGFLAQSGLGRALSRKNANTASLATPFEQLLLNSLGGYTQAFRTSKSPDKPQIASWSWVTAPGAPTP